MAQHDYSIANGSGAAVRADINALAGAIASQNSGSSAPSVTFAYMFWADTANDLMKQRNAANTAWVDLWTMSTGQPVTAGNPLTVTVHKWTATAGQLTFNGASATPALSAAPASDNLVIINRNGRPLLRDEYTFGGTVNFTTTITDIEAGEIIEAMVFASGTASLAPSAGSIGTAAFGTNSVTNTVLADMAADTIKGRANGAGTGDPTDLTAAQVRTIIGLPAIGTAGQRLQSDGTALTNVSDWEAIEINTALTATSSWARTGLSAYSSLKLEGFILPATNSAGVGLRTSSNNGSSYGTSYYRQYLAGSTATASAGQAGETSMLLSNSVYNHTTEGGITFSLLMENFNKSRRANAIVTAGFADGTSGANVLISWFQVLDNTARDAIQLLASSGNISGRISLWGLRG